MSVRMWFKDKFHPRRCEKCGLILSKYWQSQPWRWQAWGHPLHEECLSKVRYNLQGAVKLAHDQFAREYGGLIPAGWWLVHDEDMTDTLRNRSIKGRDGRFA